MAKILILGGGFGGLVAAEQLAAVLSGDEHQITLVSRKNRFEFYPALIQVVFGKFEPDDISFNLAVKISDLGVRFIQGDVVNINPQTKEVQITGDDIDGKLHYDYLIVALGRRLATEQVGGFFEHAHHILGPDDALKLGEAIRNFKREGNIIVGMCPDARLPVPVCETAFALARKFKREIEQGKISLSIVFPETIEAAFGGAKLHRELESAFLKQGINLVENFPISNISGERIFGRGEQTMNHDLLMLVPPFRGQAILSRMGEGVADDFGYAKTNSYLQFEKFAQIYAVGDIVAFSGPKLAHMAVRQAKVAADNIISEIIEQTPQVQYNHEISTIIDQGGSDTIYLRYGLWNNELYRLRKGSLWSWAKNIHDRYWRVVHS